jgi:hypothetical protein
LVMAFILLFFGSLFLNLLFGNRDK